LSQPKDAIYGSEQVVCCGIDQHLSELLFGLRFLELLVGAHLLEEHQALRGRDFFLYSHFQDLFRLMKLNICAVYLRVVVIIPGNRVKKPGDTISECINILVAPLELPGAVDD
jgi:hypothetical protein